ncbi:hypothetical protein ACFPH6_30865 [Streptomyces xiangluensis]|uniref:Uncharacterized protein n=1 Tax=Streptomyces xiangluensis TaxID=2665720 RepID=A0ABV8YUE8_9ACTN
MKHTTDPAATSDLEAVQLAMGADVLGLARAVLDDPASPYTEVRYAGLRLAECLTDALRVAESRGLRLPPPDTEGVGGTDSVSVVVSVVSTEASALRSGQAVTTAAGSSRAHRAARDPRPQE